jgi:hypothetical protein
MAGEAGEVGIAGSYLTAGSKKQGRQMAASTANAVLYTGRTQAENSLHRPAMI